MKHVLFDSVVIFLAVLLCIVDSDHGKQRGKYKSK